MRICKKKKKSKEGEEEKDKSKERMPCDGDEGIKHEKNNERKG